MFDGLVRKLLTMTILLARVLTTLHVENNHLVTFHERCIYFAYYLCTFHNGGTYRNRALIIQEQHLVKL